MDCLGLYVDVENLSDIAKEAITESFARWPEELPRPSLLYLYVKADNAGAWRMWATDSFPSVEVKVTGVQHYALDGSKNSADIALALDVIVDLLKSRISHVAILSDDSDFAILFGKIEQEVPRPGGGKLPFLWFQTDRPRTRSSMLNEFLPAHYVRTVLCAKLGTVTEKTRSPRKKANTPKTKPPAKQESAAAQPKPTAQQNTTAKTKQPAKPKTATVKTKPIAQTKDEQAFNVSLAETIIRLVPVGPFEHAECMKLTKQHFPEHSFAKLNSVTFGTRFVNTLWPILEKYGVRVPNPNRKPRRYEMTADAKKKVEASAS